ncbi:MAG: MerR family transcriptional regulator, partial [Geitlerinemataceae cyanobacterium]
MSSLLKIGELAKQTGLSIRTLHYYDDIDLLSPSHRTEVGHRLYGDRDIIRLQQILSLRQLGFSLHEIRECLENPNFSLPRTIDLHLARLQEQMEVSRALFNQLSKIAKELETTQSVAVENLIEAIETISMTEQYFTPEQQTALTSRFQEQEHQWQEMLNLTRIARSKDPHLCSTLTRALANYWQQNMKYLIGGDLKIYESLIKLYHKEGAESATWGTMDTAT